MRNRGRNPGGLRLALRIAARTSIRSLGRSALIVALVALPIAGLAGIAVVYDSSQPTPEETVRTQLGSTDAWLAPRVNFAITQNPVNAEDIRPAEGVAEEAEWRSPAELLPADTRILPISHSDVSATTKTGMARFGVVEGEAWNPAFSGLYDVAEGRPPRSDQEVMVTAALLPRLGAGLGDTVELGAPAQRSVTIVGVIEYQTVPDTAQYFFAREGAVSGTTAKERITWTRYYLPDTELDWAAVQELNREGVAALSRAVVLEPPPHNGGYESWQLNNFLAIFGVVAIGAAFAAFEVILLAGAAFTVTARQQQRTLATIASVGAPRGLLFRILSANGIVLGAIGGVIGAAVGAGGGAAFMWLTNNGSTTQYYGYHVPGLALLGCIVFAVLIGWIASLLPARNASRFDIVAALRGARKPPASSRRRPIVGLVMLVAGLAVTLVGGVVLALLIDAGRGMAGGHPLTWLPIVMLIAGPILAQLGLVLCGPLLLRAIARLLGKAGIGARLASRDAARNPGRAVPALAAIMTTVFVAVFAMCMVAASQEYTVRNHIYQQAYGQVLVPLNSYHHDPATGTDSSVAYEHPDAVERALRSTLDVDEIRILAGVPDPGFIPAPDAKGTSAGEAVPLPMIPPANQCPAFASSPEHDTAAFMANDPEFLRALDDDPRCAHSYTTMTMITGAHLFVGDADDLALVLDREPSATARATLASGGAVSLYPDYVHDGEFTIAWWPPHEAGMAGYGAQTGEPIRTETLDAVVERPERPISFGVFITPETAGSLGLRYENILMLGSTTTLPDTAHKDALNLAIQTLPDNEEHQIWAHIETGPAEFAGPILWGVLALAALIAVASAAVAIGLARFDGRQDEMTLASLGAEPLLRRSFAFWQAVIITGVGAVLGAGMGIIPALALGANDDMPFTVPGLQVVAIVVLLPMFIAVGNWLFTRRSRVSARRMTIA